MTRDPRAPSKVWSVIELVVAVLLIGSAAVIAWMLRAGPELPLGFGDKRNEVLGSHYMPSVALIVIGVGMIVHAIWRIRHASHVPQMMAAGTRAPKSQPDRAAIPAALLHLPGVGYRSFVAWRYLLVFHNKVTRRTRIAVFLLITMRVVAWPLFGVGLRPDLDPLRVIAGIVELALLLEVYFGVIRHSKIASVVFVFGLVGALQCAAIQGMAVTGVLPIPAAAINPTAAAFGIAAIVFGAIAGLAMFFGSMRAFFTFFTTVPIGGVWIGTAALVLVLAVMSGFETDLRDKILGSNAHIQITKEDGDFSNWRDAKKKIDAIPGVVASTPYAVSEVVIAANNNGMNVIIKGIDPNTIGNVTNLVKNIKDDDKAAALRRMQPLIEINKDRTITEPAKGKTNVDPPPDDMIQGGDPIDFSNETGSGSGSGSGSATPPPPKGPQSGSNAGDPDKAKVDPYGGDAQRILELSKEDTVLDLLDSDLIRWMVGGDEPIVHVVDAGLDNSLSRRTQALPGILVGAELVKQTHLYTGEEVRVVSPLSDPSNPDATGTPIPFNRDYRVAGTFYTGMYEYDLKFVYVTLDSLQDFLDLGDTVDGIEVRIDSADDTERFVALDTGLIRQALGPGYRVQDWRELNRSLFSALKLEKIAMFLVLGIVILVASFSIIGNLIMVVVEKGREIALLKTLGASDVGVMQLFAVQGLIIGLIGTTLGVTMGLLGCLAMQEFGLPLNPDVYYIDKLPIHIDPQSVAAAALTGVLISIGATLYPALLAARVRPAKGMRH